MNKGKEKLKLNSAALAEAIRIINEQESYTLLESILAGATLSEVWNDLEGLQKVQAEINIKTTALKNLKVALIADKGLSEEEKEDLSSYKVRLADQKIL